jgi:spore germination protein KC
MTNKAGLPRADAKISHWQLMSLLVLSALFAKVAPLPEISDFSMSRFLTLPVSTAIMLVIFVPFLLLSRRVKDGNLLAIGSVPLKWIIGILLIARLLYSALISASKLKDFVSLTILPYYTSIFFVVVTFAAVLYGSGKGIQATARIAPVALVLFFVTIAAVSLMLIPSIDVVRLYSPVGDAANRDVLRIIGEEVWRNDTLFFFLALSGFVREKPSKSDKSDSRPKPQSYKSPLYYFPLILVAGLWLNFLYTAVLGRFMTNTPYPLYTISSLSTFNVIERMDGIVVTMVIISGLLKTVLAFICVRAVLAELIHADMKARKPAAKITTAVLVAGIATVTFLTTGCSDHGAFNRTEQRMVVQLMGIDYAEGVYTVTVQCATGSEPNEGESANSVKSIEGQGRNIYSAIKQVRTDVGMELFFSHNQVLFLGEGVLAHDAVGAIEGYLTHATHFTTPIIAGVRGEAREILSLTYENVNSPQNRLMIILKNAKNTGVFPVYTAHDTLHFAYSASAAFFLPMLAIEDEGSDTDSATSDPRIVPDGGVLIVNGATVADLSPELCVGLALISSTSQVPSIDVTHNEHVNTVEMFRTSSRIVSSFSDGVLNVRIEFSAVTDRSYSGYQNLHEFRELRPSAIAAVEQRLLEVAAFAAQFGGDVLGIEDSLKHRNYNRWQDLTSSQELWFDTIANANFTVSVKLDMI